jgi:hypothetical protein
MKKLKIDRKIFSKSCHTTIKKFDMKKSKNEKFKSLQLQANNNFNEKRRKQNSHKINEKHIG